jgi:hypothetical protein
MRLYFKLFATFGIVSAVLLAISWTTYLMSISSNLALLGGVFGLATVFFVGTILLRLLWKKDFKLLWEKGEKVLCK